MPTMADGTLGTIGARSPKSADGCPGLITQPQAGSSPSRWQSALLIPELSEGFCVCGECEPWSKQHERPHSAASTLIPPARSASGAASSATITRMAWARCIAFRLAQPGFLLHPQDMMPIELVSAY